MQKCHPRYKEAAGCTLSKYIKQRTEVMQRWANFGGRLQPLTSANALIQ
jgi:hypothetical protein